jgi:hypothetical protein
MRNVFRKMALGHFLANFNAASKSCQASRKARIIFKTIDSSLAFLIAITTLHILIETTHWKKLLAVKLPDLIVIAYYAKDGDNVRSCHPLAQVINLPIS